jgi:hypothetical protein
MADDFTVPACRTWVIDEVFWVGTFDQSGGDIFVSFYEAGAGGTPGDLIARFQHLASIDGTTGVFATEDVLLPGEVALGPGTYWVGFGKGGNNGIGVGSPPTTSGITGSSMVTRPDFPVAWTPRGSDASFELRGADLACYAFSGFFQPIDNGQLNSAKAGQAIPVKWHLQMQLASRSRIQRRSSESFPRQRRLPAAVAPTLSRAMPAHRVCSTSETGSGNSTGRLRSHMPGSAAR